MIRLSLVLELLCQFLPAFHSGRHAKLWSKLSQGLYA